MKIFIFLLCALPIYVSGQNLNVNFLGQWNGAGEDYSDIWGYVDGSGFEYAIIGSLTKFYVVNVSDPASPTLVGSVNGGSSSIWRDMKTYSHYLYGVADQGGGTEGLTVIDLNGLPSSISLVAHYNSDFQRAHNVFIDTDNARLYVAGSSGGAHPATNGLIIYDLSANPANPTRLASLSLAGGYVHDVFVKNNIAYCSHGNSGLYVYNLSNATSPVTLGSLTSYPQQGYNHSGWLTSDGNWYVFADETHGKKMKIAHVTDPTDITVGPNNVFQHCLLPADNNCIPHNPFVLGNLVYISYYHDGLVIFDISDPNNVALAGYYDTYPGNTNYNGYEGAWGAYPFLPSGNILISDISTGLYVLQYSGVLPINLLNFRGAQAGKSVRLNWETMSELQNDHFEVERSTDGLLYETIASVPGHGNANDPHSYTAIDQHPYPGANFYRLRQVDFNGSASLSKAIKVAVNTGDSWQVYPTLLTAGTRQLTVQMPAQGFSQEIDAKLYDSRGALLASRTLSPQTSASQTALELPVLTPGIYYLMIDNPQGIQTVRLVVQPN